MPQQAINWTEGMVLRPQHFQAADRHIGELIATGNQLDHAYSYGCLHLSINERALGNFQFEVLRCVARMHDGTIISFDPQNTERVDLRQESLGTGGLKEALAANERVTVYLAVPRFAEGRANVSEANGADATRFVAFELERDDESAGGNRQLLSFREPNVRILLSTQDLQGYDILPLCRLIRAPDGDTPRLDPDYFPPCLAVDAWEPLGSGVMRGIHDMCGARVTQLTSLLVTRSIDWSSQRPGDLQRMYLAGAMNEMLGAMSSLAFGRGVHPFVAWTELCRCVGRLSILGPEKRSPEFPRYDHDDLARIFHWAWREIERLTELPDEAVEQRWFIGAGRVLKVALDPKWLTREWEIFIGIHFQGMTREKFVAIFSEEAPDWKFGSLDQVEDIFRHKKRGVRLQPLRQVPGALAGRGNWLYFAIKEDNEYMQHVRLSSNLAIRIRDDQIYNLAELDGNRRVVLQLAGQLVSMELAVFAVRAEI
jgi:type VI secretion system protein ImpJ